MSSIVVTLLMCAVTGQISETSVIVGSTYVDAGATALDNLDNRGQPLIFSIL